MKTVKVADVDLELFESGQGAPILFLHSAGGFAPQQPFVGPLSAKHRLIAPSHPGFGKSSLPEWLDSIDDIAHIYLELLDTLGLKHLDIVGCSIGGWIAAEIATKVPDRVRRLVMVSPVGVKTGSSDKLDIPDIFAMPQSDVDKLLYHDPARSAPDTKSMSDDQLAAMFRNRETLALMVWEPWMHNTKLKHRLHRVTCPALFMRGASDGLVSDAYLKAYAALLPNARVHTIAAAGHVPHLEQPEAFASTVLNFLAA
ncbi:alpha/beta fold hydrolase [Rhodoplanes sp. Z2-YC6860]|uniref:alpha/beta fold hydrolase n=1 Tax=Rhodoplanes sp. Z2-YC6860 TaxID=674703 RepID=UPI00078C4D83|nr:alpha/beta hydrolase [Rhodoplanes sp. Z2-YC6860]AMN41958.1 alpha/beta hydrolase fold protein [Rhodoplanes sp. Z2-YC6860]